MRAARVRALPLLCACALAAPSAALGFTPSDPLAGEQWYLAQDHAFDAWPALPTNLAPVRVAVVDSGIDGGHPEFAGKIVAARSFVAGSPLTDEMGHGTFVAGEIAATIDDGNGIAGIAPAAQLVIAKIVAADGTIPARAEADGIRWAVDQGARVVNLSLAGVRDPRDPARDAFLQSEAAAVRYAVAHGAVVVAAVGNGDDAPREPWPYAGYPAALPHVIGVSALDDHGGVPDFSNRDQVLNDLAAPGVDILSTLPGALTAARPSCPDQGYSDCGPDPYTFAEGTSFAAPQVAAAAADLLGIDPKLQPDQVGWLLERNAVDVAPSTGCETCAVGRDSLTGWGRLDIARSVQALLAGRIPPPDHFEPNDNAGTQAYTLRGVSRRITATVDYWDDATDVYRVHLERDQTLHAALDGSRTTELLLWKPGTLDVRESAANRHRDLAAQASATAARKQITYAVLRTGWYYLEVQAAAPGFTPYALTLAKRTNGAANVPLTSR